MRLLGCSASCSFYGGLSPNAAFAAEKSVFFADVPHPTQGVSGLTGIRPLWVAPGRHIQYPNKGGVWEYGFWDLKYRSYYTVGRCHGTTVKSGSRVSRSTKTAAGKKSVAELWTINNPWANPQYYYRVC
ncbi:lactococcin 972 family bacteriocin [Dermabacteraceae bacterium P9123]